MSVVVDHVITDNITVAKFGGTSVADFHAMLRCADIIKKNSTNRLVVVSASAGVTNHLVRLSQADVSTSEREKIITAIADIQSAITQHFDNHEDIDKEIAQLLTSLRDCTAQQAEQYTTKTSDKILSFGEQFSSRIFAQVLQTVGVNGHYFDVRQVM
jgi:aspartate kinase